MFPRIRFKHNLWVFSIMPTIPEISVGIQMERCFGFCWPEYSGSPMMEGVHIFRSVYSDQNSPFHFWKTGSLPLLGNSVKESKMTTAISIGCLDLIWKCRSIFLRHFHWSLTGQFGIKKAPFVYRTVKWFDWWNCLCIFNELPGRLTWSAEMAWTKWSRCSVYRCKRLRLCKWGEMNGTLYFKERSLVTEM